MWLPVYGCLPLPFVGHLERNEKIRFFKAKDKICWHEKVLDNCRNLAIKCRKSAKKAYVFTPFSHRNTRQDPRQDSRIPDDCPHAYLSEKIYNNIPRRVKYTLRGSFSVNHKSIKPHLFLLAGLYLPFLHHVLRQNLPAEQWRVRIVGLRIARNSFQAVRSITIPASVAAGVVQIGRAHV